MLSCLFASETFVLKESVPHGKPIGHKDPALPLNPRCAFAPRAFALRARFRPAHFEHVAPPAGRGRGLDGLAGLPPPALHLALLEGDPARDHGGGAGRVVNMHPAPGQARKAAFSF